MEKQTYFIDVIVPLSVPNKFTYRIPEELNEEIAVGKRVIIQFGKSKFYTAIIYNIHQTAPANYVAKYIESIICKKFSENFPLILLHIKQAIDNLLLLITSTKEHVN